MSNVSEISALIQFLNGTAAAWSDTTVPPPSGCIIYATDTTAIKLGDGVTLYSNLPIIITLNQLLGLTSALNNYALINSQTFTGTPKCPTPATGDTSSQIVNSQFVANSMAVVENIITNLGNSIGGEITSINTLIASITATIGTIPNGNTVAALLAAMISLSQPNQWSAQQSSVPVTITWPTTGNVITWDISKSNDFILPLQATGVLGVPTNLVIGQRGYIDVIQPAAGGKTLSYNTIYNLGQNGVPTINSGANAPTTFAYRVRTLTEITLRAVL